MDGFILIGCIVAVLFATVRLFIRASKEKNSEIENKGNPVTPPKRISRLSKSCSFYQNVSSENRSQYRDNSFYTRVVGVTFGNVQFILPRLKSGMPLQFYREPNNPYDSNAIRVECNGEAIGHLDASIAAQYANGIDNGFDFLEGKISEITGGKGYKTTYGCNIELFVYSYIGKRQPDIVCTNDNIDPSNPFYGKKCVFYDYGDEDLYELRQLAVNMGATTTLMPSSKTNFFIVGSLDSLNFSTTETRKYYNALERGFNVEVITLAQFHEIVDKYL